MTNSRYFEGIKIYSRELDGERKTQSVFTDFCMNQKNIQFQFDENQIGFFRVRSTYQTSDRSIY